MSLAGIYRKTDKGAEEIKSRAHGLPSRIRPLLILIDGKLAVEDLLRRAPDRAVVGEQLQTLAAGGFIEPLAAAVVPPAPTPVAAVAAMPAATAIADLAAARRRAVKVLYDSMGPEADGFAVRIEKTATAVDLLGTVESVLKSVEVMRGTRGAEKIRAALLAGLSG